MNEWHPRYGKRSVTTSYSDDQPISIHETIEESIAVNGTLDVLSQIGASLKDMTKTDNHKMVFTVVADHKSLEPIRIVRQYQIERANNAGTK